MDLVGETESQIGELEIAMDAIQQRFADPATMRDAGLVKLLHADNDRLAAKLKQLEQECYAREQ